MIGSSSHPSIGAVGVCSQDTRSRLWLGHYLIPVRVIDLLAPSKTAALHLISLEALELSRLPRQEV